MWEIWMNRSVTWTFAVMVLALALLVLPGRSGAQTGSTPAPVDTIVPAPAPGTLTVTPGPMTAAESLLAAPTPFPGERWSIEQTILLALERNADVRTAEARTRQASGSALSGWSGIIPSLSVGADYTYSIPDKEASLSAARVDTTGSPGVWQGSDEVIGFSSKDRIGSLGASLTSNILSFPAIGEKQRRDHVRESAELEEIETRNNTVFRVKRQYFNLLKAERLALVARETERLARDEETRAQALLDVGTVARGDLLKARARRAITQADRIRAENQVEIQASILRQIVGAPAGQRIMPQSLLGETVVLPDSAAVLREALQTRPLIESAQEIEKAAKKGLFGSKSQRLPAFSGSIDFGRSRFQQTLEDIQAPGPVPPELDVERYNTTWQGTVRASLPIFSGLQIEGDVRQAKGALLEAEALRRQRELDVQVEVQQAWLLLRESIQQIEVTREGLASAEEDYKFSKGRYDLGAGTYLDLLTAEVNLANARARLIEAVADAHTAEAGLEFAVGSKRY
jgi:outer membrane protein TolC